VQFVTDGEALIRDICTRPADDLPRLVYADWLDERGEGERAAYIREAVNNRPDLGPTGYGPGGVAHWAMEIGQLLYGPESKPLVDFGTHGGHLSPSGREMGWKWHRGFVSSISLRLASFVGGGLCGCGGVREWADYFAGTTQRCSTCSGTGRAPGLAAKLFAEHPIESVTFTDRAPITYTRVRPMSFWRESDSLEFADSIPKALVDANRIEMCELHSSPELAFAALSRAAVAYGRNLAGLSPLPVAAPSLALA